MEFCWWWYWWSTWKYRFYDDDLQTISKKIQKIVILKYLQKIKENFGFFDDVPEITPTSVMQTNDIEENIKMKKKEVNQVATTEKNSFKT